MPLETATYISDLNASNPIGATDPLSSADDHLRLLKLTIKNSFPNITGAMTASHTQLNNLASLAATSVLANATAGAAAPAGLAASADGQVLARIGGALVFSADYPRLSVSNTFTNSQDAESLQLQTNTSVGSSARSTLAAGNGTNVLRLTMQGISANALLTGGPANGAGLLWTNSSVPLSFGINFVEAMRIDTSLNFNFKGGTVTTNNTSASEVGYKGTPRRTATVTPGECLAISAGITLNTGLAAGQAHMIYNDSAAQITITQGAGATLRLAGTTTTGNRTIEARGLMYIWPNSTTEYICSGPGVA